MSQLNTIIADIQTLLATNASGVKVYRSDYVPTQLGSLRDTGYIEWDLQIGSFEQNSREYTGILFADLTVISYAVSRSVRDTVYTDVLDLFMPTNAGYRKTAAPVALGDSFLHYADLADIREVTLQKEGHQTPETPGIWTTFELKLST